MKKDTKEILIIFARILMPMIIGLLIIFYIGIKFNIFELKRIFRLFNKYNFVIYDDVIRLFDKYGKGGTLLEIGCGNGRNLAYLQSKGYKIFGIDNNPIYKRIGDAKNLKYKDNSFDVVLDRACLQHNRPAEIKKIIKEVKRVLRPKGIFMIINFRSKQDSSADNFKEDPTFRNYDYVHYTDNEELNEFLKDFKILHWEHRVSETTIPKYSKYATYFIVAQKL